MFTSLGPRAPYPATTVEPPTERSVVGGAAIRIPTTLELIDRDRVALVGVGAADTTALRADAVALIGPGRPNRDLLDEPDEAGIGYRHVGAVTGAGTCSARSTTTIHDGATASRAL